MSSTHHHPLENDVAERAFFTGAKHSNERAVYRRAVERLTGSLPTWAKRGKPGRPRKETQQ